MDRRLELQKLLEDIMRDSNDYEIKRNVYFQPPESIKIEYPAIVYSLNQIDNVFADDIAYMQTVGYQITIIDRNPDSPIVWKLSLLPKCHFVRHYKADNLNHWVFIINY